MKIQTSKLSEMSTKDKLTIFCMSPLDWKMTLAYINTMQAKQTLITTLKEKEKIISYGMSLDGKNSPLIIQEIITYMNLPIEDILVGNGLFTRKNERGKGYAKLIKQEQIISGKKSGYTHSIGFTNDQEILHLHLKKYGAQHVLLPEELQRRLNTLQKGNHISVFLYKHRLTSEMKNDQIAGNNEISKENITGTMRKLPKDHEEDGNPIYDILSTQASMEPYIKHNGLANDTFETEEIIEHRRDKHRSPHNKYKVLEALSEVAKNKEIRDDETMKEWFIQIIIRYIIYSSAECLDHSNSNGIESLIKSARNLLMQSRDIEGEIHDCLKDAIRCKEEIGNNLRN